MIPDLGDIEQVDVIELPVQLGSTVKQDDVLLVLESDKATMEVVAPCDGVLNSFLVKEGDTVRGGQKVAELGTTAQVAEAKPSDVVSEPSTEPAESASAQSSVTVGQSSKPADIVGAGATTVETVPDLGDIDSAEVIELCVAPGDSVQSGDPLLVLESDKASMEVPASRDGTIDSFLVSVGDKIGSGTEIAKLSSKASVSQEMPTSAAQETTSQQSVSAGSTVAKAPAPVASQTSQASPSPAAQSWSVPSSSGAYPEANVTDQVHAGPAVRRLANELHVDLSQVLGSGPRGRILKEDVHQFVNTKMKAIAAAPAGASGAALGAEPLPDIDFSQWGSVEQTTLSRIQKISAQHLHRSWTTLPHVTQFEEADITELEKFRQEQKARMAERGVKLTPLAFIMKASMLALAEHPKFKASLKPDGVTLVLKQYCHIGFACETPNGLVVPVVKDVDKKSIAQLASEIVELSIKAREKRLKPDEMKGAVFSISSLGGIGGTAFTPIINWPEVAILGVSKNMVKPVWNGSEFQPRTMVPLSLSYDHRVIDGADAARFTTTLKALLEDLRTWVL